MSRIATRAPSPSGKTAGEAARDTACEKTPDPRKTVDP
jgi:hypothetical protein